MSASAQPSSPERVSGRALLVAVALALGARVLAALVIGDRAYFPDETDYVDAAQALLAGHGFGADYYRGPIYPVLLAGLSILLPGPLGALRAAQGILAALGTLLVVGLAERIFGRRTALVAGVLYALDPLLVVASVLLYPETFTALVLLMLVHTALTAVREARLRASVAAGLALAVAVQLRPIAAALLPVVVLWIAARAGSRRLAHATAVVAACVAGLAPWMAVNHQLYGRIMPQAVSSVRDAQGIGRAAEQGTAGLLAGRAAHDPLAFLRRTAAEFAHFWEPYPQRLATDDAAYRARLHGDDARIDTAPLVVPRLRDVVSAVTFGTELLLAAGGLIVGWRTRRAETMLLALLVFSYAIGCTLYYAKLRYRIPVLPYILTFSAVGAINFLDILRAPRGAPRSGGAAPARVRNRWVMRPWDLAAYAVLSAVNVLALWWFAAYWLGLGDRWTHPVAFWVATGLIAFVVAMGQLRWLLLLAQQRPESRPPRPGLRVGVATTFVPGLEPIEMLEETVAALVAMDYPHETWVLDEGDDAAVRQLCARLGARHFTRRGRPEYQTAEGRFQARTKHGNYNAWLKETGFARYDVIVAFDPDHVPRRSYLERTLGYFDDPRVGYVQPAQVYYNQDASFVARGAAEETYAYYSSHQMASHALGHPIVTGCHNAHRATALREVGGLAPHDADDLLITLLYRAAGWRGVYVPEVLAKGLTPVDWDGYLAQQRRWARSVLDVKLHAYPRLAGRLPFKEKVLSALHGVYYLRGLGTLVGYGMIAWLLLGGTLPQAMSMLGLSHVMMLFVVLHLTGLYRQRFYLDPAREMGVHWRAGVLQTAKWPFLLAAVADVVAGRHLAYAVTRKNRASRRHHLLTGAHWLIALAIATAWAVGVASGHAIHPVVQAWAALIVLGSLLLVWTDHRPFPPPYERARFAGIHEAGPSCGPEGKGGPQGVSP